MRKILLLLFTLVITNLVFSYTPPNEVKKLKGVKVEILYTEYDKSEIGIVNEIVLDPAGNIGVIYIVNDKNEKILIPIESVKSIKILNEKK